MIVLKNKPLKSIDITSEFGIRKLGDFEFHPGIDLKAAEGIEIYAVDNGFVAVLGNDPAGYGLYVVLDHGIYCTLYAHLQGHILKRGQLVQAGEVIGYVGMTGYTTGSHLHFEVRDCSYDDKNFWLKSNLKGRHAMCIDSEVLVKEAKDVTVRYKKYNDRIHELRGEIKDLRMEVVDKKIWNITEFTNCVNGTFFMLQGNGETYPTSILYQDGVTYQDTADHYHHFGTPQSVFIIYKNGTVDMKRIRKLTELDVENIRVAIGGLGLRNTKDTKFYYSPVTEGFKDAYADVLRKANKTVIGYNAKLNKVYLLVVKNATHGELLNIISDNSTGEAYDIALSVDGGGSTIFDYNNQYIVQGQNTRRIHNIIRFK